MTIREITIGRDKNSDIYLDDRCIYASSNHATIYFDGQQMMYRDTSRNGTMVNNIHVKQRAVPINRGDTIMIAGQYQISWTQIDRFFPPQEMVASQGTMYDTKYQDPARVVPNLNKWNWGGFGCYPIWGFFNGCWWAFFVGLLLGIFFPIPNIVFGIYGTKWAWQNKQWESTGEFLHSQHVWGIVGIVLLSLTILSWMFFIIRLMAS